MNPMMMMDPRTNPMMDAMYNMQTQQMLMFCPVVVTLTMQHLTSSGQSRMRDTFTRFFSSAGQVQVNFLPSPKNKVRVLLCSPMFRIPEEEIYKIQYQGRSLNIDNVRPASFEDVKYSFTDGNVPPFVQESDTGGQFKEEVGISLPFTEENVKALGGAISAKSREKGMFVRVVSITQETGGERTVVVVTGLPDLEARGFFTDMVIPGQRPIEVVYSCPFKSSNPILTNMDTMIEGFSKLLMERYKYPVLDLSGTGKKEDDFPCYNSRSQMNAFRIALRNMCTGCRRIIFDKCQLTTLSELSDLSFILPALEFLSIRDNLIEKLEELDEIRKLDLVRLNLQGNKFSGQRTTPGFAKKVQSDFFPALVQMDGVNVPESGRPPADLPPILIGNSNLSPDEMERANVSGIVERMFAFILLDPEQKTTENLTSLYSPGASVSVKLVQGKRDKNHQLPDGLKKAADASSPSSDTARLPNAQKIETIFKLLPGIYVNEGDMMVDVDFDPLMRNVLIFTVNCTASIRRQFFSLKRTFMFDASQNIVIADSFMFQSPLGKPLPLAACKEPKYINYSEIWKRLASQTPLQITSQIPQQVAQPIVPQQIPQPAAPQVDEREAFFSRLMALSPDVRAIMLMTRLNEETAKSLLGKNGNDLIQALKKFLTLRDGLPGDFYDDRLSFVREKLINELSARFKLNPEGCVRIFEEEGIFWDLDKATSFVTSNKDRIPANFYLTA